MAKNRGSAAGNVVMNAGNRTNTRYELASEFAGDGATGANAAYGNAPRTMGARVQGTTAAPRTTVNQHGSFTK